MISIIKKHIIDHFPFLSDSNLLIAISGGIDSVVLAHIIHTMGYKAALAHVNFQLRGEESENDATFVKNFGEKYAFPVYIKPTDTEAFARKNKISIQMAARQIRYTWFDELIAKHSFDFVVTAHHQDDQIETFIINLNRKSGIEGLVGIPEKQGKIIRPLLVFSRKELKHYAEQNHLNWREDSSNLSNKYQRNHIRHELLPVWEQINANYRHDIATSMAYLKESLALLDDYITLIRPQFWNEQADEIIIDIKILDTLSNKESILLHCLKPYGFKDWKAIQNITTSQSGKTVCSESHQILKDREKLILTAILESNNDKEIFVDQKNIILDGKTFTFDTLPIAGALDFSQKNMYFFDTENIKFPLTFRHWHKNEGEFFYPLGTQGKKKLSNFFTDQKISLLEKEKIWLLCDANNQILWVVGYRSDHRFRITDNTKTYLKISINL